MKVLTEDEIHGDIEEPPVGATVLLEDDQPGYIISARHYRSGWITTASVMDLDWHGVRELSGKIIAIFYPDHLDAQRVYPNRKPRELRKATFIKKDQNYEADAEDEPVVTNVDEANIVTSKSAANSDLHFPVFDLDVRAHLVPSTTPGHSHLYIDQGVNEDQLWKVCDAMADAGILEPGYVQASKRRGYTAVRLPWIKKEKKTA